MAFDVEKDKQEREELDIYERGHDPLRAQQVGLGRVTRKLLTWGVETTGQLTFVQVIRSSSMLLCRNISCTDRATNRHAFPQNILCMVLNELQYPLVSPSINPLSISLTQAVCRFSAGTTGPLVYGLGLRDSCLIILFFNILCCAPPAYL